MSRFPIRSSRRVVVRRQPIRNMMLDGGGASGNGDRGALQHAAQRTSNPYYSNNFLYRWQEYTRWYTGMTNWVSSVPKRSRNSSCLVCMRKTLSPLRAQGAGLDAASILHPKRRRGCGPKKP